MRLFGFITLIFLSLAVAGYAIGVYGFLPLGSLVHPGMRDVFVAHPVSTYAHIFAASVALLLGPFQFWTRLRTSRPVVHRWMGRVYLGIGVLVGGIAGLVMSFNAFGGPIARVGFACLALMWLYTGFRAYRAIRAGDTASHRRWMVRNFALTFAAVTLRIWLPGSMVAGIDAEVAYRTIAWLCWVPNLLVAELAFNRTRETLFPSRGW
ncbi:hypothetical protein BWI17_12275 [Betaproteobacteria bacterium GR16-43]|nr:hypothetical protein BWI17_12275 [Betaproteobacteria bacterium GR16-43]